MTGIRRTLMIASLLLAVSAALLALSGTAHAQATLTTPLTKVAADASVVCVAGNASDSLQAVTVYLHTTEGREIKTCGYTNSWGPGRFCVTQPRSNTTAFCKIQIEAPGDATSVPGSLAITDLAGNQTLLLEAKP